MCQKYHIWNALGRLQALMKKGADGLEIDVDNAVGLGRQARGLGRRFGARKDGHGQQNQDRGHDEERAARASLHEYPSKTKSPPACRPPRICCD